MNRIAIAQTNIIWEDKKANLTIAEQYIIEAKNNGAAYVFFPEMSFTGFSMNTDITSESDGYTKEFVSKLALKHHIGIGFGWVERNELAYNHYSIVNDEGVIISDYKKIHPFSYADEDRYFSAGDKLTFFSIFNITWSTFICYDLRFPEIFQIASKKSDIIIVPANWPERRTNHWVTLLKARAIENQVYIIAVNCYGDNIGGIKYCGNSCVINPNGDVLLSCENEGLYFWDMTNDVKNYRDSFPFKKDRREELYYKLLEENNT